MGWDLGLAYWMPTLRTFDLKGIERHTEDSPSAEKFFMMAAAR